MAENFEKTPERQERKADPMTRRDFIKNFVLPFGVAAVSGVPLSKRAAEEIEKHVSGEKLEESIETKKDFIKKSFGVDIIFEKPKTADETKFQGDCFVKSEELSTVEQNEALDTVILNFKKYPPFALEMFDLKRIIILKSLYSDLRGPVGGVGYNTSDMAVRVGPPSKLAIGETKAFFLDTLRWGNSSKELNNFLNHELFHTIDLIDDDFWQSLDQSDINDNSIGYVTHYASENSREDKAETFVELFTHTEKTEKLSQDDKIVEKKVAYMKKFLYFLSGGLIDKSYWESLPKLTKYEGEMKPKINFQELLNKNDNGASLINFLQAGDLDQATSKNMYPKIKNYFET